MTAANNSTPIREPLDAAAAFALGLWPALRNLATPQRRLSRNATIRTKEPADHAAV